MLASPWGEPLLIVDEAGSGAPGAPTTELPCQTASGNCTLLGNGTGAGQYNGSSGHPNIFQGQISGNGVTFANVPLDSAGSAPGASRVLRIVNLRADATTLVPPPGSAAPLIEALAFSGSGPSITNATPTVAFVQKGLDFSASSPSELAACGSQQVGTLHYAEASPIALNRRTEGPDPDLPVNQSVTGSFYNSETGFFNSSFVGNVARGNLGRAGLADFGTRLKAVFDHVPDGASVFVPVALNTSGTIGKLQLVTGETDAYTAVGPSGGGPAGTARVDAVGGTATAVWEVVDANPNSKETLDIPVYATSGPGAGTMTVRGGFAPTGSSTALPRFADPAAPVDLVKVNPCPVAVSGQQGQGGGGSAATQTIVPPGPTGRGALIARVATIDRKTRKGTLPFACALAASDACAVSASLKSATSTKLRADAARKKKRKKRPARLGSATGRVTGGASGTVTVTVTRATLRTLKRKRSLAVTLDGTIRDGAGVSSTLTDRVTLTLAKAKAKKRR